MNDSIIRAKEYLKIPMDRIGVIIGPRGEVKKKIEEITGLQLTIDSAGGTVEIQTTSKTEDPLSIFRAKAVCEAIGLGFSPQRAFRLFKQEELLKIIDLKSMLGKREGTLARIKGRVIGERGKARAMIEELTGARVSVYNNTVAIIGTLTQLRIAEEAINMLVDGAFHKTVYQFLFKKRRDLKKARIDLLEVRKPTHNRNPRKTQPTKKGPRRKSRK
ncbi:MAG: KH domain-containing protein [Candidatus Ranarchaeia archaeon]